MIGKKLEIPVCHKRQSNYSNFEADSLIRILVYSVSSVSRCTSSIRSLYYIYFLRSRSCESQNYRCSLYIRRRWSLSLYLCALSLSLAPYFFWNAAKIHRFILRECAQINTCSFQSKMKFNSRLARSNKLFGGVKIWPIDTIFTLLNTVDSEPQ